jgi:hypothetical protein
VLSDESMMWKSPWTGDLLPKASPDIHDDHRSRVRSFPSFSVMQPASSRPSVNGSRRWSTFEDVHEKRNEHGLSHSSSFVSNGPSRRSSTVQLPDIKPRNREPLLRETRKAPLFYLAMSETGNDAPEVPIQSPLSDSITSPGEHSFPLIRRRSLLKPGIATRSPQEFYRRPLSLIKQEDDSMQFAPTPASRSSRWPLYEPDELYLEYQAPSVPVERTASPIALDYSHLGGFKRGSLRIVNGSTSPAPSDRARQHRMSHPSTEVRKCGSPSGEASISAGSGADSIQSIAALSYDTDHYSRYPPSGNSRASENTSSRLASSQSALHEKIRKRSNRDLREAAIPQLETHAASLLAIAPHRRATPKNEDDVPKSPFSFESSPTTTGTAMSGSYPVMFPKQGRHDEAISLPRGERTRSAGRFRESPNRLRSPEASIPVASSLKRDRSRSRNNGDSGYSSLNSDLSDGSSNLSKSPPRQLVIKSSAVSAENGLHDISEKSQGKPPPHHYALHRKSKESNLRSSTEPDTRSSASRLTTSSICQENVKNHARNRRTSNKQDNRRHSSCGTRSQPRFYAELGPRSIPSVPAMTGIQLTDSESEDTDKEVEAELTFRRRRFSASQMKLGILRSAYSDTEATSKFDFSGEKSRRVSGSVGIDDATRGLNPHGHYQTNGNPTLSKGTRIRSVSEPRVRIRQREASQSPPQTWRQPHPVAVNDIPPVPPVPTMFEKHIRSPRLPAVKSVEFDREVTRGRARTRSMNETRARLMRIQCVSLQKIDGPVTIVDV